MWTFWLSSVALAGQVDRWVEDGDGVRAYHVVWDAEEVDGSGPVQDRRTHRIDTVFQLELAAVEADRLADAGPTVADRLASRALAVEAWAAREGNGVTVEVTAGKLGLRMPPDRRDPGLLKAATEVSEAAKDAWMPRFEQVRTAPGKIEVDLPGMVARHAAAVRPVAEALRDPLDDEAAFAARALQFVQSIPYEARRQTVWGEAVIREDELARTMETPGYTSFRRPLSLIDANTGDCDGKTVLYLAMIRALYPEVPLVVVRVPNHVYGGVAVDGWDPGTSLEHEGRRYTVVEPTGPALLPAGRLHAASAAAGILRVEAVPP